MSEATPHCKADQFRASTIRVNDMAERHSSEKLVYQVLRYISSLFRRSVVVRLPIEVFDFDEEQYLRMMRSLPLIS